MTTKLLAFDGRMGASGDMILATLIDVGADASVLEPVEAALGLEYRIGEKTTCGIHATTVDVLLQDSGEEQDETHAGGDDLEAHGHSHNDAHNHGDGAQENGHHQSDEDDDHHHHSDEGHDHHHHSHGDHDHHHHSDERHTHETAVRAEGHGPHRSYLEVCSIVESMALEQSVEAAALAIFERLGEAEATIHGTDLEEIHFHEVGADDAIADVVGAALLLESLEIDRVVTTPVSGGGGSVSMSHGEYPIPAPATLEIASHAGWQLRGGPVDVELLTPTGAAILGHYAEGIEHLPSMTVDEVGYGAGGYDLAPHPNVLRATVGTASGGLHREDIAVLETNVDDATPEVLGGLQETLTDAGARDVSIVPVTMKKSRPGHLIKVICRPADRQQVARALAEETGTLGIRDAGVTHRWIANRSFETVALEYDGTPYEITVKIATDADGAVYDVSAEYDDVAAVARTTGRSIRTVAADAERAWRD